MKKDELAEIPAVLAEAIVFANTIPPHDGLELNEYCMGMALVSRVRACAGKTTRDESGCRRIARNIRAIISNYPEFFQWILGYPNEEIHLLQACVARCARVH